jgi:hypothetical protein
MKTICAWCKQEMTGDPNDPVVSHEICEPCAVLFELQVPEHIEDKLTRTDRKEETPTPSEDQ